MYTVADRDGGSGVGMERGEKEKIVTLADEGIHLIIRM